MSEHERDGLAARLGDRHLRSDPQNRLLTPASDSPRRVRIAADPELAATVPGQHTLWMLTNLLARQYRVISELEVAVPQVALRDRVALFGGDQDLSGTLARTARLVAGTAMAVTEGPAPRSADIEVLVGAGESGLAAGERIRAYGCGWDVWAGMAVQSAIAGDNPNPLGPYFAACVAAGEVFKRLRVLKPGKGRLVDSIAISLWDWAPRDPSMSGPSGIPLAGLELPPWYLIGAGAVGQALVAAIIAARVRAHLTVIDGDAIDDTNLNRYILAVLSNLADSKADLAAGYLRAAGLRVYSYGSSWPKYAYSVPHIGQRADLQASEAEYKYARVLSCVDKNTARRAIQQFWPQLLLGASTDGMGLQVTHYDMNGPYECLKCSNPAEVNLRTLEDAEADLRSRSAEEVRAAALAVGADPDLVARYLADPKCGELGQQELAKFLAASDERAFSVGFVSVAAGVLLGAQLFKGELAGWDRAFPPDRGATLRLSFLNPGPHWSKHLRREQECDCSSVGRQEYGALWV